MKTTACLAAVAGALLLASGCTGGLRHKDRAMTEPVRLPSAPALEHSPTNPTIPNMGSTSTPLSPTSPSGVMGTR
jgi:hypothetical protein